MKISLTVNDKPVDLNVFVKAMFGNVVEAMVHTLKDVEAPDKIEIRIEK